MVDLTELNIEVEPVTQVPGVSLWVDYYLPNAGESLDQNQRVQAIAQFLEANDDFPLTYLEALARLDPYGSEHFYDEIFLPTLGSVTLLVSPPFRGLSGSPEGGQHLELVRYLNEKGAEYSFDNDDYYVLSMSEVPVNFQTQWQKLTSVLGAPSYDDASFVEAQKHLELAFSELVSPLAQILPIQVDVTRGQYKQNIPIPKEGYVHVPMMVELRFSRGSSGFSGALAKLFDTAKELESIRFGRKQESGTMFLDSELDNREDEYVILGEPGKNAEMVQHLQELAGALHTVIVRLISLVKEQEDVESIRNAFFSILTSTLERVYNNRIIFDYKKLTITKDRIYFPVMYTDRFDLSLYSEFAAPGEFMRQFIERYTALKERLKLDDDSPQLRKEFQKMQELAEEPNLLDGWTTDVNSLPLAKRHELRMLAARLRSLGDVEGYLAARDRGEQPDVVPVGLKSLERILNQEIETHPFAALPREQRREMSAIHTQGQIEHLMGEINSVLNHLAPYMNNPEAWARLIRLSNRMKQIRRDMEDSDPEEREQYEQMLKNIEEEKTNIRRRITAKKKPKRDVSVADVNLILVVQARMEGIKEFLRVKREKSKLTDDDRRFSELMAKYEDQLRETDPADLQELLDELNGYYQKPKELREIMRAWSD